MRTLADRAALAGFRQSYVDALAEMLQHLQNEPLTWGDPLYRMPHQGRIVCHAMVGPVIVHYSVHEPENTVLIADVKPMFDWPIRP
jgi:hypothetical protein